MGRSPLSSSNLDVSQLGTGIKEPGRVGMPLLVG